MITPQVLAGIGFFEAFGPAIIILGAISPLLLAGVVYYLKKRLDHRQIMAAIEKGTPLSDFMPPKPQPTGPAWIKYAAIGVALLLIGLGTFIADVGRGGSHTGIVRVEPGVLIGIVAIGAGAGWLTRGVLHRKYYIQDKAAEEAATKAKK